MLSDPVEVLEVPEAPVVLAEPVVAGGGGVSPGEGTLSSPQAEMAQMVPKMTGSNGAQSRGMSPNHRRAPTGEAKSRASRGPIERD